MSFENLLFSSKKVFLNTSSRKISYFHIQRFYRRWSRPTSFRNSSLSRKVRVDPGSQAWLKHSGSGTCCRKWTSSVHSKESKLFLGPNGEDDKSISRRALGLLASLYQNQMAWSSCWELMINMRQKPPPFSFEDRVIEVGWIPNSRISLRGKRIFNYIPEIFERNGSPMDFHGSSYFEKENPWSSLWDNMIGYVCSLWRY